MRFVFRYISLFSMLLVLFFFTGITCAPFAQASPVEVDQCCDKESAPEFPVDEGDCFNCGCLSCLVVIHVPGEVSRTHIAVTSTFLSLLSEETPSGYPRLIDYPPEVS